MFMPNVDGKRFKIGVKELSRKAARTPGPAFRHASLQRGRIVEPNRNVYESIGLGPSVFNQADVFHSVNHFV
jgi:hypothetical protein